MNWFRRHWPEAFLGVFIAIGVAAIWVMAVYTDRKRLGIDETIQAGAIIILIVVTALYVVATYRMAQATSAQARVNMLVLGQSRARGLVANSLDPLLSELRSKKTALDSRWFPWQRAEGPVAKKDVPEADLKLFDLGKETTEEQEACSGRGSLEFLYPDPSPVAPFQPDVLNRAAQYFELSETVRSLEEFNRDTLPGLGRAARHLAVAIGDKLHDLWKFDSTSAPKLPDRAKIICMVFRKMLLTDDDFARFLGNLGAQEPSLKEEYLRLEEVVIDCLSGPDGVQTAVNLMKSNCDLVSVLLQVLADTLQLQRNTITLQYLIPPVSDEQTQSQLLYNRFRGWWE